MTEQLPTAAAEAERISLLRDPPAPPGYVDPLEGSPTLHGDLPTNAPGKADPSAAARPEATRSP